MKSKVYAVTFAISLLGVGGAQGNTDSTGGAPAQSAIAPMSTGYWKIIGTTRRVISQTATSICYEVATTEQYFQLNPSTGNYEGQQTRTSYDRNCTKK